MRWSIVTLACGLVGCGASEVQSQRLKDGSWSFQCELSMDECVRRVQENCPYQRFRILEGSSETRLRDAPPFERAYHTSRLHLVCNDGGASVLFSTSGDKAAEKAAGQTTPVSNVPAQAVKQCTLGQTRECVGPGACKGGQSCLTDGSGFGACDCGPARSESAEPSAPEAVTLPVSPTPAVGSASSAHPAAPLSPVPNK